MPRFRTVLFDLDGTLIDSIRLILDSYHHTLATHGLPPRSDADWLRGVGTPLWVQFAPWAADQDQLNALVATYREYNLRNHDAQVATYPGVPEMVSRIRAAGVRTAVVTSKMRDGASRGLRVTGLDGTMELIIGADDVQNYKPHPEPVLCALAALGETADAAVYVGDSVHDMVCGRAAGTATAAVLWGPFGREHLHETVPDYWLEQPGDLVRLLEI